jgi:hypothetical protein
MVAFLAFPELTFFFILLDVFLFVCLRKSFREEVLQLWLPILVSIAASITFSLPGQTLDIYRTLIYSGNRLFFLGPMMVSLTIWLYSSQLSADRIHELTPNFFRGNFGAKKQGNKPYKKRPKIFEKTYYKEGRFKSDFVKFIIWILMLSILLPTLFMLPRTVLENYQLKGGTLQNIFSVKPLNLMLTNPEARELLIGLFVINFYIIFAFSFNLYRGKKNIEKDPRKSFLLEKCIYLISISRVISVLPLVSLSAGIFRSIPIL